MDLKWKKKPSDGSGTFDVEFHFKGTLDEFRQHDWRELK